MYLYEVWTCMSNTHEFVKQGTFTNRAAAESIVEVLRQSSNYYRVWVEEKWDPDST